MSYADENRLQIKLSRVIVTHSGKRYHPFAPKQEEVDIEDIAHALANQCRYAGHVDRFYSVAEHSVLTSYMVPRHQALEALLHDAAEAYCHDVATPIKYHLPEYLDMIEKNEAVIRQVYHLPTKESASVRFVDSLIGKYERLMLTAHWLHDAEAWKAEHREVCGLWALYRLDVPPSEGVFLPLFGCNDPVVAKERFLHRYESLR